jgi:hypothetical protein
MDADMTAATEAALSFAQQIVASGCTLPPPNFGVVAMQVHQYGRAARQQRGDVAAWLPH